MKKYLIVLMILFITMGVFSMDILGRSSTDIQRRMVDQTNYRINVVKGVVATVNVNKTFGCYIAGETVIYPNIPTFSRDPKLEIGDEVTIEFINGCREIPCILAPEDIRERLDTTIIVPNKIFAYYYQGGNYYIKCYDNDGNLLDTWTIEVISTIEGICADINGNVYTVTNNHEDIIKRNNAGVIVKTKTGFSWIEAIAIGPDGFLYCKDFIGPDDAVLKINLTTLEMVSNIILPSKTYYGMVLDSNGYIYMVNTTDDLIEKWDYSAGALNASHAIDSSHAVFNSLGIAGNLVASFDTANKHAWTMPKNLGAGETDWDLDTILKPDGVSSINGDFLFIGYYGSPLVKIIIGRYTEAKVKVWEVEIAALGNSTGCIAAYPF